MVVKAVERTAWDGVEARPKQNKTTLPVAADPSCSPHGSGKFRTRNFPPGPLPSRGAPLTLLWILALNSEMCRASWRSCTVAECCCPQTSFGMNSEPNLTVQKTQKKSHAKGIRQKLLPPPFSFELVKRLLKAFWRLTSSSLLCIFNTWPGNTFHVVLWTSFLEVVLLRLEYIEFDSAMFL